MRYVVYLTTYKGDRLPPKYIGSTNEEKALSGNYFGSVTSLKWKDTFNEEVKNNKHLFSLEILSYHDTRNEAIDEECRLQKLNDVVKSGEYFNQSYATKNGYFGFGTVTEGQRAHSRILWKFNKCNPMKGRKRIPKFECKYCEKVFDEANFGRSHGEKCHMNPNSTRKKYTCEYCGAKMDKTNLMKWHNDKCKHKQYI